MFKNASRSREGPTSTRDHLTFSATSQMVSKGGSHVKAAFPRRLGPKSGKIRGAPFLARSTSARSLQRLLPGSA
jgi:hypothetical protein